MNLKKGIYLEETWKRYIKHFILFMVFFLAPFVCCEFLCWTRGVSLTRLTPFGIVGNDEVIYQKMVEGVIRDGMPSGYFGYNESHAMVGTFSTWSPILLLQWSILGELFGWGISSPVVYNILLLMLAMGIFYILAKPDVKQTFFIIFMYAATVFISWYALLTLPEIACYSLIIMFCALSVNLSNTNRLCKLKISFSFVIVVLLTWMRPYYIVLILLPAFELIKRSKKKINYIIVSFFIFLSGGGYAWINRNMCAPYFTDLLDFSWMSMLWSNPIIGVKTLVYTFLTAFENYLIYVREGVLGNSLVGAQCAGVMLVMGCLIFCLKQEIKEKKLDAVIMTGVSVAFIFLTYCAAAVVFEISASAKHFGELIVLGIFVIGWKRERKTVPIMLVTLCWIYFMQAQYYPCIEKDEVLTAQIEEGVEQLSRSMEIEPGKDCWDNTVIWVYSDDMDMVWWQGLYALPAGTGINLCYQGYVLDNWENLQAKYLYTSIDGTIDKLCADSKAVLIAEYGEVHVWELRKE